MQRHVRMMSASNQCIVERLQSNSLVDEANLTVNSHDNADIA
jgi:hypothetical protein